MVLDLIDGTVDEAPLHIGAEVRVEDDVIASPAVGKLEPIVLQVRPALVLTSGRVAAHIYRSQVTCLMIQIKLTLQMQECSFSGAHKGQVRQ